jgi:hypothetical protein
MQLKLDRARLSAISRLFSSAVFKEMAATGCSPLFGRLAAEAFPNSEHGTLIRVSDAFESALRILRNGANRDEYVYKTAITQRILLGRHSLQSACMLNEYRIGECKADIVILNGSATVYEIKSERDSLSRLEKQLSTYQTVFPKCYVIVGENHADAVLKCTSEDVGVLGLTDRNTITTIREAQDRLDLVKATALFDSIRAEEAIAILNNLDVEIPQVPNTRMRGELRRKFESLTPLQVYPNYISVLKRSRSLLKLGALIDALPSSLHAAALTIKVKRAGHANLATAVACGFADALNWA